MPSRDASGFRLTLWRGFRSENRLKSWGCLNQFWKFLFSVCSNDGKSADLTLPQQNPGGEKWRSSFDIKGMPLWIENGKNRLFSPKCDFTLFFILFRSHLDSWKKVWTFLQVLNSRIINVWYIFLARHANVRKSLNFENLEACPLKKSLFLSK